MLLPPPRGGTEGSGAAQGETAVDAPPLGVHETAVDAAIEAEGRIAEMDADEEVLGLAAAAPAPSAPGKGEYLETAAAGHTAVPVGRRRRPSFVAVVDEELQQTRTQSWRQALTRFGAQLCLVALAVGVFLGVTQSLRVYDIAGAWDPSAGLQVDVENCDVRLVASTTARVRIEGDRFRMGPDGGNAFDYDVTGAVIVVAYARSGSCAEDPSLRCHDQCQITIGVPPGGASGTIFISQLAASSLGRVVVEVTDVTLQGLLKVSGDNIELRATGGSLAALRYTSTDGSAYLDGISYGAFSCQAATAVAEEDLPLVPLPSGVTAGYAPQSTFFLRRRRGTSR